MNFNIVTYVSAGFYPCLELTLRSWRENSGADHIYIYTDNDDAISATTFGPIGCDTDNCSVIRKYSVRADDGPTSWMRKIEVIQDALPNSNHLVWLDADVYCTGSLEDAFKQIGNGAIGATRMFNSTKRGGGAINAGVLFFNKPYLSMEFTRDWRESANYLRPQGFTWFEQEAASRLLHEAFDGLKDYYCTPLSENVWNCEDDIDLTWLVRIDKYHPKLIHFKGNRWKNEELVGRVLNIVSDYLPIKVEHLYHCGNPDAKVRIESEPIGFMMKSFTKVT